VLAPDDVVIRALERIYKQHPGWSFDNFRGACASARALALDT
jgi:hypothetical protein